MTSQLFLSKTCINFCHVNRKTTTISFHVALLTWKCRSLLVCQQDLHTLQHFQQKVCEIWIDTYKCTHGISEVYCIYGMLQDDRVGYWALYPSSFEDYVNHLRFPHAGSQLHEATLKRGIQPRSFCLCVIFDTINLSSKISLGLLGQSLNCFKNLMTQRQHPRE